MNKVTRFKKFIKFIWLMMSTLSILGLSIEKNTFAEEPNNIQLGYKILESYSTGEDISILVKLKVENMGPESLYGVKATVSYIENMTINTDQIYFGDINSQETVESPKSFIISFKRSLSQDPPQKGIVWRIEYIDIKGNSAVEEVLLR